MAQRIPLNTTSAYYRHTTTIGIYNYDLEFKYNTRESSWYLSISNNDNELLLSSLKLLPGFNIIKKYAYKRENKLFENPLVLINLNTTETRPIALNNMGIDYQLFILEEGEY